MEFSAVPREFLFVAASCRWPLAGGVRDELRRLSSQPLDWPYLLQIVRRHRVAGLVHNAVHAFDIAVPRDTKDRLAEEAGTIARRNVAAARESLRLQRRFDEAGIPLAMLKGVTLAQTLHGSIGLRHARDIDVLVPPEHATQALRLLQSDGYALVTPQAELSERQIEAFVGRGYQMELLRTQDRQCVELHWRLAENPFLLGGLDAFSRLQSVQLGGGTLRSLDGPSLFAYLCVHGAGHFWFRLKWLADIEALVASQSEAEIERLYRFAASLGAGPCAAQALLLCKDVFGTALPPLLHKELAREPRNRRLVRLAWRGMIGADPAAEPARNLAYSLREVFGPFLLGRGFDYVRAQCAITLVAPADVIRWTMPRWLGFMYGILRLPFWLWRRAMLSRATR